MEAMVLEARIGDHILQCLQEKCLFGQSFVWSYLAESKSIYNLQKLRRHQDIFEARMLEANTL